MALLYFRTQYTFPYIFLPVPTGTYQCCFFHYPTCRGFVTADVLEKGLSHGAIAMG